MVGSGYRPSETKLHMVTEMTEKVFIGSNDMATFKCPECMRTKTASVSRFRNIRKAVHVKCKCPCGHTYSALLERRKHIRKDTHFAGIFIHENGVDRGTMDILDLSRSGLKIKTNFKTDVKVGDKMKLEFILDDKQHSKVSKEVIVRSINGLYLGTEFVSLEHYDKLGSYLLFDFG
ncbi:MAG: PilZ domain-containing protein [Desulfobacteraceae bacterium]|nr:MAG: PilZ domain-containing protein [Desulfobacteraceae bacterium]